MDKPKTVHTKHSFEYEVLRARLEIRDFFLKNLFREIYENIGQVLSLARILLAKHHTEIDQASQLVGKSIRDLRDLSKAFYPDADIMKEDGFNQGLKTAVAIIFPGHTAPINIKWVKDVQDPRLKLILFNLVLGIAESLKELNNELSGLTITFTKTTFKIVLSYTGQAILLEEALASDYITKKMSWQQKAGLVNAKFEQQKNGSGIVQLKLLPLN